MRVPSGWYGGYTLDAEVDGVVVQKGLDLETLPLPAVKFAFESTRDAPVGVRLTERLPEPVSLEHVAVHSEHGGQHWTAFTDGRLVYTGSVPPGETVVTLLMAWLEEPNHIYRFLGQPHLRVTSNPNAPSLRPVGVETDIVSVDGRFTTDESFTRIRAAVERSLSTPTDGGLGEHRSPTAGPTRGESHERAEAGTSASVGGDRDAPSTPESETAGDVARVAESSPDEPAGSGPVDERPDATAASGRQVGPRPSRRPDHSGGATADRVDGWPHPVLRGGIGELGPPDDDALDELLDGPVGPGAYVVRVETTDTYHGGGAVVVAQELANAFEIHGRRVTGHGNSDLVEAVVVTDAAPERIVTALADRKQVLDVFVSPVDGTASGETDPEEEAVAVFEELAAEFDPVDAAELEAELDEADFPGPDGDEVSIAELVDGDVDVTDVAENADEGELGTLQDEIGRLADRIVELEAELAALESPADDDYTDEDFDGGRLSDDVGTDVAGEEQVNDADTVEEVDESGVNGDGGDGGDGDDGDGDDGDGGAGGGDSGRT